MRGMPSTLYFGLFSIISSPAFSDTASDMEEVVVTATRTGESNLQETPMAISVFSEEDLNDHGIENVRDLVRVTPGLQISQNSQFAHIYIRGVGSNNSFIGSDPSSTLYVDGIYISRPLSLFSEFLGTERIEVLRGPQGVLYGRNSTGGAINVISAIPEEDNFFTFSTGYGSYNERTANFSGNAILNDKMTANLSLTREVRDGYVENNIGDDVIDKNVKGARGALRLASSDDLDFILRGDYIEHDETGTAYKATGIALDATQVDESHISPLSSSISESDFHTINANSPNIHQSHQKGLSLEINQSISSQLKLTYLPAYRSSETYLLLDSDWTENLNRETLVDENQTQNSHEIRLHLEKDSFDLLIGTYYFREHVDSFVNIALDGGEKEGNVDFQYDGSLDTTTSALFANGKYKIDDKTLIELGIRYSREKKSYVQSNDILPDPINANLSETWNEITPKLTVQHNLSSSMLFYGSISEGFKSGGYNMTDGRLFEPEHLLAYELGAKTSFIDEKITVNSALFHYDYEDLQVSSFRQSDGMTAPVVNITNAPEASITGIEMELALVPNRHFDLKASVAYLNAEYDDYSAARTDLLGTKTEVDVSGNKLNHAPEYTATVDIGIHHPAPSGTLNYLFSTYWQDKEYFTALNDELTSQDEYTLHDLTISYVHNSGHWEIAAFGRNLTDEEYSNAYQDFSPTGVTLNIMPPRTYGLEVTFHSR